MTDITEQKVGYEPPLNTWSTEDLLDEKENSTANKNQQCPDSTFYLLKGDGRASVGDHQGESIVMSTPVLKCSWNGLRSTGRQHLCEEVLKMLQD